MRLSALCSILLAPALAVQPAAAQSSDDERARIHCDAGSLHYEEGAYDRALVEFERAWELSRRAELLINMATVRERLSQHREAAANLREYLRLRPEDPNAARLERRIANLQRLAAEGAGTAQGAEEQQEEDRAPRAAAPRARAEVTDGGGGISPVGPIVIGVGVAALLAAAITGGVAVSEGDRVRASCAGDVCPSSLRDDAAAVDALAITTDVLWVTGLVAAATGLVLTFVLEEGPQRAAASRGSVRLALGPGGVAVGGTF